MKTGLKRVFASVLVLTMIFTGVPLDLFKGSVKAQAADTSPVIMHTGTYYGQYFSAHWEGAGSKDDPLVIKIKPDDSVNNHAQSFEKLIGRYFIIFSNPRVSDDSKYSYYIANGYYDKNILFDLPDGQTKLTKEQAENLYITVDYSDLNMSLFSSYSYTACLDCFIEDDRYNLTNINYSFMLPSELLVYANAGQGTDFEMNTRRKEHSTSTCCKLFYYNDSKQYEVINDIRFTLRANGDYSVDEPGFSECSQRLFSREDLKAHYKKITMTLDANFDYRHILRYLFYDAEIDELVVNCSTYYSQTRPKGLWKNAFEGCHIKKLIIKRDVPDYYPVDIFQGAQIDEIVFSQSPTKIPANCFRGLSGEVKINLGSDLEEVGDYAFYNTKVVTSQDFTSHLKSVGAYAFCGSGITSFTASSELQRIGTHAFENCTALKSVDLSKAQVSLGSSAFKDCINLSTVNLHSSTTEISYGAFKGCKSLTHVTFPYALERVGSYAFADCSLLERVSCNPSLQYIDSCAFQDCSKLSYVGFNNMLLTIGNFAFAGCCDLQNVQFGSKLQEIGSCAFYNYNVSADHPGITSSITFPSELRKIGARAFAGNPNMGSITLDHGIVLGKHAFEMTGTEPVVTPSPAVKQWYCQNGEAEDGSSTSPGGTHYVYSDTFKDGYEPNPNTLIRAEIAGYFAEESSTAGCPVFFIVEPTTAGNVTHFYSDGSQQDMDEYGFYGRYRELSTKVPGETLSGKEYNYDIMLADKTIDASKAYRKKVQDSPATASSEFTAYSDPLFMGERTFASTTESLDNDNTTVLLDNEDSLTIDFNHGKDIEPEVHVIYDSTTVPASNYTVSYADNCNPGTATVTITFDGSKYDGTLTKQFTIGKHSIADDTLKLNKDNFTCTEAPTKFTNLEIKDSRGKTYLTQEYLDFTIKNTTTGETFKSGDVLSVGQYKVTATPKEVVLKDTLKATDLYSGSVSADFEVYEPEGSKICDVHLDKDSFVYTGHSVAPKVYVDAEDGASTLDGTLEQGVHYTVTYSDNTSVGDNTAKVTVTGKHANGYRGTITKTFSITPKPVTDEDIVWDTPEAMFYIGEKVEPVISGKIQVQSGSTTNLVSIPRDNYTVTLKNNLNVGENTASVTIRGQGNYTGTLTKKFSIVPGDISDESRFFVEVEDAPYLGGSTTTPMITLTNNKIVPATIPASNYDIVLDGDHSVGEHTGILRGKNNMTGERPFIYTVANMKLAENDSVTVVGLSQPFKYTGSVIQPSVSVILDQATLKEGKDYTVSYSNNVKVGTAAVTITNAYDTSDKVTKTFEIVKDNPLKRAVDYTGVYDGSKHHITVELKDGVTGIIYYGKSEDAIDSTDNVGVKNSGTATVYYKVVPDDTENYSTVTGSAKVQISKAVIGRNAVILNKAKTEFTYNKQAINLDQFLLNTEGFEKGVDYSLQIHKGTTSVDEIKNAGTYTLNVTKVGEQSNTVNDSDPSNLEMTVVVKPAVIAKSMIDPSTLSLSSTYDGTAKEMPTQLDTTIKDEDSIFNGDKVTLALAPDKASHTNAGTYNLDVTGTTSPSNFTVTDPMTVTYTINKADSADIVTNFNELLGEGTYTTKSDTLYTDTDAIKASDFTFKYKGTDIASDKYSVKLLNCDSEGTGTVTVSFDNFAPDLTKDVRITKSVNTITNDDDSYSVVTHEALADSGSKVTAENFSKSGTKLSKTVVVEDSNGKITYESTTIYDGSNSKETRTEYVGNTVTISHFVNGVLESTEVTTTEVTEENGVKTTKVTHVVKDKDDNVVSKTVTTTVTKGDKELSKDIVTEEWETITSGDETIVKKTETVSHSENGGKPTVCTKVTETKANGDTVTTETKADGTKVVTERTANTTKVTTTDADGNETIDFTEVITGEDGSTTTTNEVTVTNMDGSFSSRVTQETTYADGKRVISTDTSETDVDGNTTQITTTKVINPDGSTSFEKTTKVAKANGDVVITTESESVDADGNKISEVTVDTTTHDGKRIVETTTTEEPVSGGKVVTTKKTVTKSDGSTTVTTTEETTAINGSKVVKTTSQSKDKDGNITDTSSSSISLDASGAETSKTETRVEQRVNSDGSVSNISTETTTNKATGDVTTTQVEKDSHGEVISTTIARYNVSDPTRVTITTDKTSITNDDIKDIISHDVETIEFTSHVEVTPSTFDNFDKLKDIIIPGYSLVDKNDVKLLMDSDEKTLVYVPKGNSLSADKLSSIFADLTNSDSAITIGDGAFRGYKDITLTNEGIIEVTRNSFDGVKGTATVVGGTVVVTRDDYTELSKNESVVLNADTVQIIEPDGSLEVIVHPIANALTKLVVGGYTVIYRDDYAPGTSISISDFVHKGVVKKIINNKTGDEVAFSMTRNCTVSENGLVTGVLIITGLEGVKFTQYVNLGQLKFDSESLVAVTETVTDEVGNVRLDTDTAVANAIIANSIAEDLNTEVQKDSTKVSLDKDNKDNNKVTIRIEKGNTSDQMKIYVSEAKLGTLSYSIDISVLYGANLVSETTEYLEFVMDIPEELLKSNDAYEYSVVRTHNGKTETLPSSDVVVDKQAGTVTFKTKKFSAYGLVYKKISSTDTSTGGNGGGSGSSGGSGGSIAPSTPSPSLSQPVEDTSKTPEIKPAPTGLQAPSSITAHSIVLPPNAKFEYLIDGASKWTTSSSFNDLKAGTLYNIYVRYKDIASQYSTLKIKTLDEVPTVSSTALYGTTVSTTSTKAKQVKWKAVKCATKYVVSYRQVGSTVWTNVNVSANSTSYKTPNLSSKYAYELKVTAYARANGKDTAIASSPSVYTAAKSSADAKSVKVKSSSVLLKKGKTSKIKATIKVKVKSAYSSKYVSQLRYVSSDAKVATVTDKGVIKAKSKGKTTIYVMTANGKTAKVKVTVK